LPVSAVNEGKGPRGRKELSPEQQKAIRLVESCKPMIEEFRREVKSVLQKKGLEKIDEYKDIPEVDALLEKLSQKFKPIMDKLWLLVPGLNVHDIGAAELATAKALYENPGKFLRKMIYGIRNVDKFIAMRLKRGF
ncbi:MAG: hypothetical protein IIZ94_08755, partial [Prevotella sp.]|nr:hypothetical protein [Prevotella sp.]